MRLADLATGRVVPGLHQWQSPLPAAYIAGAVRRAGGFFAYLDGSAAADRESFHTAIAVALDLPDYYGRNLDALNECLGDVVAQRPAPRVLLWDSPAVLAAAEPRTYAGATRVLGSWLSVLLRDRAPS